MKHTAFFRFAGFKVFANFQVCFEVVDFLDISKCKLTIARGLVFSLRVCSWSRWDQTDWGQFEAKGLLLLRTTTNVAGRHRWRRHWASRFGWGWWVLLSRRSAVHYQSKTFSFLCLLTWTCVAVSTEDQGLLELGRRNRQGTAKAQITDKTWNFICQCFSFEVQNWIGRKRKF